MDGRMKSETATSGPTTNVRPRPKLPSALTSHAKPLDRFYTEDNHNTTCNSNFLLHQQPQDQQQQHEQKMADSEFKLEQPFASLSGKYRRSPAAPTGRASFNSSPYLAGLAASPLPVKPPSSCPPKLLQEICEQVSDTDDLSGRQTEAWYAHASDDEVLKSERTRTFSIQPGLDSNRHQEDRFDHPRGVSTLPRNQSMSAYDRSSNRDYTRPCSRRLNRRVVERSDTNLGVTNEWQTPQTWANIGHANSDPSRRDMYVKPIGGIKDPSSMSVSEDMFDERAMGLRKQVHRSPSDVANAVVRSFSLRKPKNIEKLVSPHCFTPAAGNGTDTGKNGDVTQNDCKGSVQKTEDEGVGAVDLEGQSFSDAYIAVIHGSKQTPGEGALDSAGKHQLRDDVWQTHLGGRNDEGLPNNNRRGQRYVDQATGSGGRETASRFLTHPPVREKSLTRETGSIDSNGLGSLKNNNGKIDSPDGAVPPSSVCSLDSHLCQSEAASDVTSALHVEFELSSDNNNGGRLDRRNSKTLKQKSKSDPSGEKTTNADSLDLQNLVCYGVYAHSSPLLLEKEKHQFPFTDRDDSSSIGPERTSSFEDALATADPASAGSGYDSPCGSGTGIPASNQDIKIKVVLKSDDSFDDGANSLPPVVKPPRPRAPKRKSRAASTAAAAAAAAADAANSPAEARRTTPVRVPPQKANSTPENDSAFKEDATPTGDVRGRETSRRGTTEGGGKGGGSGGGGVKIFSPMSALTLPLIKKSTLLRSHSTTSPDRPAGESPPRRSNGGLQQEHHKTPPPVAGRHASGDSANMLVSAGGGSIPELFSHKSKTTSYSSTASYSYSPSLDLSRSNLTLFGGASEEKEKRDFILQEFYNSEQDYVETLQMLVEKYMIPMKTQNVIDNSLTDEIFYKINEIYMHHATFITFLAKELQMWDSKSTIGNVIYKNFSKQTVIDSYISFIEHFPRAEKVLDEISTKSSFQRFIEVCERETKTKLPLKAQIVKPAQRIPRYELLIRRLLENTPPDHPDFALLEQAGKTIHELALKINSAKESKHEEEFQETLKKLELLLITDLVGPYRQYIRHDLVLIADKKDQCCLWLFSDLVIFSFLKRKSTNVNRRTSLLLQSPSGHDFVENTKHKVWLKLSLDAIDIVQVEEEQDPDHQLVDKEELEEDFQTLEQMTELSSRLKLPHQPLDDAVTEMLTQINKQLSEHQLKTPPPEEHALELITNTPEGLMNIVVLFPSADKKNSWETSFIQYKQKIGSVSDDKQPEFMHLLSITKTRAGMQFICATPTEPSSKRPHPEVLVCNSDGHYGHVCLLSLQEPEPMVTLNTPVPGCNARILCMCAVPPDCQPSKRIKTGRRYGVGKTDAPLIRIEETKDDIEAVYVSDSTSDSSMEEDGEDGDKRHFQPLTELESGETPPSKECSIIDRDKGTVWFGTEDGWICIFASTDNIKTTKNKLKISVSSSVLSIVNLDQTVFASLENGDIVVFTRNGEDGSWNEDCASEILAVSNSSAPITKMMPVSGKLWCTCLNDILVLDDVTTRNVETRFSINQDTQKRGINCMTWSPTVGVWIAGNGSSSILLFHASTYEQLLEVNVANAVALRLQATDDIIRQHKMACLRITALLSCKDLLWIGTSAGVILTLPIPKTTISNKTSLTMPTLTSLDYGHTGHVRFLTSVDMPTQVRSGQGRQRSESTGSTGGTGGSAKASYTGKTASSPGNVVVVVVSGGDGTENFKSPTGDSDEPAGKEDSTNHLLLWKV